MKLYLEKLVQGHYANVSFYAALEAYHRMGFDVEEVTDFDGLEIEEPNIFLGSIQFVEQALEYLNIEMPQPLDYPEELQEFLGRKIWISTINEIAGNPENWNVFVKPRGFAKKFTGRYIQSTKDLVGCGDLKMNTPVWVSEPKSFVAEWRVFVRYGRVLSVRSYKGDWRTNYDAEIIQKAVDSYTNAPAGYALDFGLTKNGEFLLVEANDGYSLGNYGLFYVDYAKLLSARWAELTRQEDICNF